MLLTITGAVVLAIACAGLVSLAYRIIGQRAPKGLLPLVGGVAMIGFMAWNENSWFTRQAATLPDSHVVIATGTFSNFIQPWTLIWPRINRYMLVDTDTIEAHRPTPGLRRAEIILAQRYTPTVVTRQFIDCDQARRADHTDATEFDDDGRPVIENWVDIPADGDLMDTVCNHPV